MYKIIGKRGSGKTTALIELAHHHGYVLVEPNHKHVEYALNLAKELGYDDVRVVTCHDMTFDEHYVIDGLDEFLKAIDVVGYSNGEG